MIETLEDPHLALHIFLNSLYFLLRNRLQRNLARDVDRWRSMVRGSGAEPAARVGSRDPFSS